MVEDAQRFAHVDGISGLSRQPAKQSPPNRNQPIARSRQDPGCVSLSGPSVTAGKRERKRHPLLSYPKRRLARRRADDTDILPPEVHDSRICPANLTKETIAHEQFE